ncbi:MAG: TIGR03960 family B12-binding radical SAM protein [Candidatus Aminicenantes bacterium]|nr:MAG: TIGR03960 family B12-binding radical SAM protein [Candidatus Aminicenantes bacterium]
MIEWNDLEDILQKVEKPGRYLGGEWNSVKKKPDCVDVKVALAFPDVYEVGMSYLGQKILYQILNSHPRILAERVFAPWWDLERELRAKRIPLFSLENRIPLERFDIIGFSLLYELNYTNVLNMLDLGRIPLFSDRRSLEHPLVISGGPAVFNPEPVADYCDLFVIGDGEEVFLEVIQSYMALKEKTEHKADILGELAKIKGVYVPSLYESYQPKNTHLLAVKPKHNMPAKIKKKILVPFQKAPFPEEIIVPHIQVIFDRIAWEVARGCPQKCRFCQALSIYFPPRVKSPSSVIKGILNSLRSTGYDSVSLASLSVSDYPYLEAIIRSLMEELEKQNVSLSLSSLRPKGLTSDVVANIVRVRKTGFTLVPEAGTERLRNVINKCLKNDEIEAAAENAFSKGWKRLKLYFMIGLPSETDEDLMGIVRTVKEVRRIGKKLLKRSPLINLSISSFIPKPHTPFQWLRMEKKDVLHEKFRFVLAHLKEYPSIRLKRDSLDRSVLECVFSRGDRRLNPVLHNAWKCGARFDSWDDVFKFSIWEKAFESENLDYREYLSELDKGSILPWDHIDTGLTKNHLLEELELALDGKSSPPCSERECAACQGCSFIKLNQERFDENVIEVDADSPPLGKRTDEVQRYRASFRKINQARYLSHMDLNNIIQQGFRRAGILVSYSQGFHPKMLISHPPALPLGMEGKAEWVEFKSPFAFSEEEFISRINPYLVEGVEFIGLSRLDKTESPMNRKTKAFVYSVDLGDKKVMEAVKNLNLSENVCENYWNQVKKCTDVYAEKNKGETLEKIYVDEADKKLFLIIKNVSQKGEKPQDIVSSVLGLENPVFAMAREQFLLEIQAKS